MGVSTDGQLAYGYVFEDGYKFPWGDEENLEEWWLKQTGWKWEGTPPFDEDGEYAPGVKRGDPMIDQWYDSQKRWMEAHPIPVALVNYQMADNPAYMLVVPGSLVKASRGYPKRIGSETITSLWVSPSKAHDLIRFVKKYDLKPEVDEDGDHKLGWYLTSYWG